MQNKCSDDRRDMEISSLMRNFRSNLRWKWKDFHNFDKLTLIFDNWTLLIINPGGLEMENLSSEWWNLAMKSYFFLENRLEREKSSLKTTLECRMSDFFVGKMIFFSEKVRDDWHFFENFLFWDKFWREFCRGWIVESRKCAEKSSENR